MSDQTTPSTPAAPQAPPAGQSGDNGTPHAGAGGNGGQQPNTPAGSQAQAQPAQPQTPPAGEPYRTFATQKELEDFFVDRAKRAERSGVRQLAKEFGFEDVDDFRDAVRTLRGPNSGAANGGQQQPGSQNPQSQPAGAPGPDLAMAIRVAAKLNLPATLIPRLQGGTDEEMEADAQSLMALMGQNGSAATPAQPLPNAQRAPGIPPVPPTNQPVTLTRSFLRQNPQWVRANRAAVEAAQREGRIVDS